MKWPRRRRPARCNPVTVQHLGPFESTPIPSIDRCLACGCVFGQPVTS